MSYRGLPPHKFTPKMGVPVNRSGGWRVFLDSKPVAAARLPWSLADQPQNRNEPQVNRALRALSPSDVKSRARLRTNVGEALDGHWPLIIVRRIESELAPEHEYETLWRQASLAVLVRQ